MSVNLEPNRLSLAWSSLALLLVVAAVSGGGVGALVAEEWPSMSSTAWNGRLPSHSKTTGSDRREPSTAAAAMPTRVYLPAVAPQDIDGAIDTMGLSPQERRQLRSDLATRKLRLLWLTLWDWDTTAESGDTISIAADDYQRLFTLSSHRTKIAIPEPRSGRITFRGERTEDGIIAISFLTGNRPIALPYMRAGDTVELEVDAR